MAIVKEFKGEASPTKGQLSLVLQTGSRQNGEPSECAVYTESLVSKGEMGTQSFHCGPCGVAGGWVSD